MASYLVFHSKYAIFASNSFDFENLNNNRTSRCIGNRIIMMDIDFLLGEFEKLIKREQGNIPYNFNILDEQCGHIVENSHTNILMKILQYKVKYKDQTNYVFLESFFDYLNIPISINFGETVSFKQEFSSGQQKNGRIDGFIYQKNSFALIIENKVNGAGNRQAQLKNYIEGVLNDKEVFGNELAEEDRFNKIWVIFLTKEGVEKPDKTSCDYMKEKGLLDNVEDELEGQQFAAVNYRDHILPWLKEEIHPIVMQKEQVLNTGLIQYIDFLEGIFGMRKQDKDLMDKCKDAFEKFCNINDIRNLPFAGRNDKLSKIFNNLIDKQKKIKRSKNDEEQQKSRYHTSNILKNLIEQINEESMKSFIDITRHIFESEKLTKECVVHPVFNFNYIQIRDTSWPRSIHFEWYPFRQRLIGKKKEFIFCFHVECKKEIRDMFVELEETFQCAGFKRKQAKETSRTLSYTKEVSSEKPILEMNDSELNSFLEKAYESITPELIESINSIIRQLK